MVFLTGGIRNRVFVEIDDRVLVFSRLESDYERLKCHLEKNRVQLGPIECPLESGIVSLFKVFPQELSPNW